MIKRVVFCLFTLAYSAALSAHTDELRYKGKPIDSLCFYDAMSDSKTTVLLGHCGISQQDVRKITGGNKALVQQGFVGYDYSWAMDKSSVPSQGYMSYYKVVGAVGQQYVVQTINNSGGSGLFSAIILVSRHDDKFNINVLASGDRCFRGIVDAKLENQKLIYSVNITPEDLLKLSHPKSTDAQKYNLADCASCCIGTAEYEHSFTSTPSVDRLHNIQLTHEPQGGSDKSCFDKLISAYQARHEYRWDATQLETFMQRFKKFCG